MQDVAYSAAGEQSCRSLRELALQQLLDRARPENGEFPLTTALQELLHQGAHFVVQEVAEWLDCGNKAAVLHANQRLLAQAQQQVPPTAQLRHSVLIPPVHLGAHAVVENAVLGPYVAVGPHTHIKDARVQHSIIQAHSTVKNIILSHSIVGRHAHLGGQRARVSIGDYASVQEGE